ncbi:hypothetical protein H8Z55_17495 [Mycobacteroides abscessus]|uniref:hypothetical protein n=1 Tax=Mycobacteroides abscessus TaxID=36809 RepID=UPI001CDD8685|nr:hypothetical protein [Mycobacteroides abscessus]MCA4767258.1 hypothetical protein [Mycobacteroides abscessus]UBV08845.1 hypothetical protein H8Z55_17495 [Mycobacteroides abscessus]UBV26037.1 hypothetical protein H8Z67_17425 [Mycobacteroides abscessus]
MSEDDPSMERDHQLVGPLDIEHTTMSLEQALGHPLNPEALECLKVLVTEALDFGYNTAAKAAKNIVQTQWTEHADRERVLATLEQLKRTRPR